MLDANPERERLRLERDAGVEEHLKDVAGRMPGGKRGVTQITEITGYDPHSKCVATTEIFSCREEVGLVPTGYMPSFIDQLVSRKLLKLEFLYGEQP